MNVNNSFRIGKVSITCTNPLDAEKRVTSSAIEGNNGYICVSNMRTVVLAQKDTDYCNVMNNAWMCLPDGTPLEWMAKLWGQRDVKRTTGPDLFLSMLGKPQSGVKHFLLGDTDDTLASIKSKYKDAAIVGTFSPPFCQLDEYDFDGIAKMINESRANIVWVSLRAPKQDYFSARLSPSLDGIVCIGVGAAFRFALGEIQHPNKIIQKLGLTGLLWRKNKIETLWNTFVRFLYLCKFGVQIIWRRLWNK